MIKPSSEWFSEKLCPLSLVCRAICYFNKFKAGLLHVRYTLIQRQHRRIE